MPEQIQLLIDRYLIREIARPMIMGLGLFVVIFVGYSSAQQLSLAAERAIDLPTVLKLVALNTLTTLDILLPSALFFSVLAGLGRLYQQAEMSALSAAGVSPWQVLWAVFKLALVVALLVSLLSVTARPWIYQEIYRLETQAAAKLDVKGMGTGGFVQLDELDYVFIAGKFDIDQELYHDVFLYREHGGGDYPELIHARSAELPDLQLKGPSNVVFYNVYQYLLDMKGTRDVTIKSGQFTVYLPEADAKRESYRRKAATTQELGLSDSLKDLAEYQWRLSVPLATILLALIAVPLSRVSTRQSRFRNVIIAIAVYILVFSFTTVIRTWLEQGFIPPLPGLWLAYLLPALILIVLLAPGRRLSL